MKIAVLTLFMLLTFKANSSEWAQGDVILLPLNCYSCRIIESETGAPYSHSGVLFKIKGKWRVGQSLGVLNSLSVKEFLKMGRKETEALHLRPLHLKSTAYSMEKVFKNFYEGLPFDKRYLWNNFDENSIELLYCSEFVVKFLNHFLSKKIRPIPMDFRTNWDFWYRQWNGDVPQGEPGFSPADFFFSKDFKVMGKISL